MGCSSSQAQPVLGDPQHEVTITDTRYWHRVKSEEELISSRDAESYGSRKGERDRIQMEFRALLDYPIGRLCLLDYSKSDIAPFVETCLHGWLDIKAFNSMVAGPTQKTMALSVFKKYVNNSSLVLINERERLQMLMTKPEMLVSGVFDEVEEAFFMLLYDHLYLKFRTTPQYKLMCSTMRKKYNRVKQKDFLYHQLIGQGGFGLVCEVSKISTGARYAMKLQRKVHMIEVFGDEPWRADTEKRAFASCHHPFIVELFFAFQTESLAIMVISLGTGRDLSKVLRGSGPLMIDQVVFYGAEIVSALSYLHDKGLIYRDLKPGNVLLNLDGHIQLVDFGGVCDINGNNFRKFS